MRAAQDNTEMKHIPASRLALKALWTQVIHSFSSTASQHIAENDQNGRPLHAEPCCL